ncbi:hypothetical protein DLM78_03130 [Leptospira stimsonii]|uniref:Uncharacterized protein n=1 Tax=Leptospira stimsonii TaxID=2202203 RepID=A0A8B3CUQ8_9LEPT|nr:hypothetical protein DLM78_03130 [Leptospira stimsonii]
MLKRCPVFYLFSGFLKSKFVGAIPLREIKRWPVSQKNFPIPFFRNFRKEISFRRPLSKDQRFSTFKLSKDPKV